jgi:hypothetical protein
MKFTSVDRANMITTLFNRLSSICRQYIKQRYDFGREIKIQGPQNKDV